MPLNLYKSPACEGLVTQAWAGRQLRVLCFQEGQGLEVQLCEDGYRGWLNLDAIPHLNPADQAYQAIALSRPEIQAQIPAIIAFTQQALATPNHYLWGGTVGPNYDCSGLMQAAFAASGIWLPRDSYQQAAFTERIDPADLLPGDLVFFGPVEKVNHVGLYLGHQQYIHSSGKDKGRNGIGIDSLSDQGDPITQVYYRQFWGAGRVVKSFQP